ncbi:amidase domain-containing protein [Haloimpatiens sp. FM7315]|uniref:amidase domain-containing protein n=1 Tax=Haloimpatiens sp. FM7315 TaxID=3298609 RepID=UPI0035A2FAFC
MSYNEVYNRINAQKYAESYALTPNIKEYPYYKNNDCTNFVSQTLHAGGLKMEGNNWKSSDSWFCNTNNYKELKKVSLTFRSADYFLKYWGNYKGSGQNTAYYFFLLKPQEFIINFNQIYNMLEIGDVIQYGNPKPYHSQIVHNKIFNPLIGKHDLYMAQHSSNKLNISLYNYVIQLLKKENPFIFIYKIKA